MRHALRGSRAHFAPFLLGVLSACGGGDGGGNAPDTEVPTVSISAPSAGVSLSGDVTVSATASDNESVSGVTFQLDGDALGSEDADPPYQTVWHAGNASAGTHTLSATARDPSGNVGTAAPVEVTVLATGAIRVVAVTTGAGTDRDGYTVTVDGSDRGTVEANGTLTIDGVTVGAHTVTLAGVSAFCTPTSDLSRQVTVGASDPVDAGFAFTCEAAPAGRIAITVALPNGGSLEIHTIRADGSGETTVALDGDYATWSPDRTQLAFLRFGLNGATTLFRVNADGSGLTELASLPVFASELDWGPGGTLVFSAERAQGGGKNLPDLYYIEADGSGLRPVFVEPGYRLSPTWSPDGTHLAFCNVVHLDPDYCELSVAKADGTSIQSLTSGKWDVSPAWSPDGTMLAFRRDDAQAGTTKIWIVSADGSGLHQLTDYPGLLFSPSWSPDGQWIAFTTENAGGHPLLVARSDGSEVLQVSGAFQGAGEPDWAAEPQ